MQWRQVTNLPFFHLERLKIGLCDMVNIIKCKNAKFIAYDSLGAYLVGLNTLNVDFLINLPIFDLK